MSQILSPRTALSSPRGARRLGRPRLLIVGCGDVGTRILRLLSARMRVFAVTSQPERRAELRTAGAVPLVADLDRPATLARLSGLAERVIDLAPPPGQGEGDPRTLGLLGALRRTAWRRARFTRLPTGAGEAAILPERGWHRAFQTSRRHRSHGAFIYASTTGVYGDRGGARVREFDAVRPQTARARRRVVAETAIRHFGKDAGWRTGIVRIPGIYAEGRLPLERLKKRTPALRQEDDVYTNHIHADDLARILIATLWRGRPQRIVHASDDTEMRMGDYFDFVADQSGLPRPPRISRVRAGEIMDRKLLSFMSESRRLDNTRLRQELKLRLRFPTISSFYDRRHSD